MSATGRIMGIFLIIKNLIGFVRKIFLTIFVEHATILFRPGVTMPVADFARKWLCFRAKLI